MSDSITKVLLAVIATVLALLASGSLQKPAWLIPHKRGMRQWRAGETTPLGVTLRGPTEEKLQEIRQADYVELNLGSGNRAHKDIVLDQRHRVFRHLVTVDMTDHQANPPTAIWDLEALPYPFEDNSFDEIHAYQVLEHTGKLGDWKFFFAQFEEFHRILKPGGHIALTVPHHTSPWLFGDPGHTRVITNGTLLFLDQYQYHIGVGRTTMTDYRPYFDADFTISYQDHLHEHFYAALRCNKPVRRFDVVPEHTAGESTDTTSTTASTTTASGTTSETL